jgi:hypothetical protein
MLYQNMEAVISPINANVVQANLFSPSLSSNPDDF